MLPAVAVSVYLEDIVFGVSAALNLDSCRTPMYKVRSSGACANAWTKSIFFVCHPCTAVNVSSVQTEFHDATGEYVSLKCTPLVLIRGPSMLRRALYFLICPMPHCGQYFLPFRDFGLTDNGKVAVLELVLDLLLHSCFELVSIRFPHGLMVIKRIGVGYGLLRQE